MATYIHGIGASENIDSSGERLSIAGMDVSTLDKDGVFTYEHELAKVNGTDGKPVDISVKIPSQVVGKILKVKKIFSEADCDDEHQLYFFKKCGCPYLYVMGELFDDYTEAAKDLAGKFRYDADRKNQNERPVMNFSIEGGKMAKEEITVTRSVARKVTITVLPCNKAAIAEIIQVKQSPTNSLDELFKTENVVEIEVFKSENIIAPTTSTALTGVGPTGNLISTEKMKKTLDAGSGLVSPQNKVGGSALVKESLEKTVNISRPDKGFGKIIHIPGKDSGPGKVTVKIPPPQNPGKVTVKSENIVTPKEEMVEEHKELVDVLRHPTDEKLQSEAKKQSKELKEYKKSKWLARAEEEYQKWEKREQFELFMKSKLPHLTKGEIVAIGQVLALQKSINMENALLKMAPSLFSKK